MIQRRQTVYIIFSIIAMIVFMVLPYAEVIERGQTEIKQLYARDYMISPILSLVSIVISTFAIFQYRTLSRQYILVMVSLVVNLIVVGMITYDMFRAQEIYKQFQLLWVGFLPSISLLLLLLASRSILKDANIMKSSNRLR